MARKFASYLRSLLTPKNIVNAVSVIVLAVAGFLWSTAQAEYRGFKETLQTHESRLGKIEAGDVTAGVVDVQYKSHVKSSLDDLKEGQKRQDEKLTRIYELLIQQANARN